MFAGGGGEAAGGVLNVVGEGPGERVGGGVRDKLQGASKRRLLGCCGRTV